MRKFIYIAIVFSVFIFYSCSTKYLYPELVEFSEATDLIGKNVIYSFEKLQEEEMNLRIAQVVKNDSIKPSDLEPHVLTFEHLEIRKELIRYIINYTKLLASIFRVDSRKEISDSVNVVKKNLDTINKNHDDFLSKSEMGIISTIAAAIPEALTYAKKRSSVLKIMKQNQKLLKKIIQKLKGEIELTKLLIDNYYSRQFRLRVAEQWPEKESKREKIAKLGVKIIKNKNKINIILTDLIEAISYIPKTHKELMISLKTHKTTPRSLRDLINFAYRMKELYRDFSEQ